MKNLCAAFAVCLMAVGFGVAEEKEKKIESGLPVGETVPAFNVRDITGPNKDKTLCYRCQYGARPVVAIFTRNSDKSVTELITKLEKKVADNDDAKMAGFVIMLSEDSDKDEEALTKIASENKIKTVPLTLMEGTQGPPDYKIAKDAEVTVMMWVESEVKVNHAFAKDKLDDKAIEQIIEDTAKILE